jgi:hypothetical protein
VALDKQHVLSKKEKALMRVVYMEAEKGGGTCVLTPIDMFQNISLDLDFEQEEIETTLRNLQIDEYFEYMPEDKKGEFAYKIVMSKKGLAYARVEHAFKSNLKFKIMLALICGLVSGVAALGMRLLINSLT